MRNGAALTLTPSEGCTRSTRPKSASNIGAKKTPGGFFRKSVLDKGPVPKAESPSRKVGQLSNKPSIPTPVKTTTNAKLSTLRKSLAVNPATQSTKKPPLESMYSSFSS